ncbi:MAG: hypothetical protein WCI72_06660 [archaeon]
MEDPSFEYLIMNYIGTHGIIEEHFGNGQTRYRQKISNDSPGVWVSKSYVRDDFLKVHRVASELAKSCDEIISRQLETVRDPRSFSSVQCAPESDVYRRATKFTHW